MPLIEGHSQDVIDANIKELKNSGMSEKQAIAVSLKKAGKAKAVERAKTGVTRKSRTKVEVK